MDHLCCDLPPVHFGREETAVMAFREVLVTQVREVLRAWLGGLVSARRPAGRAWT